MTRRSSGDVPAIQVICLGSGGGPSETNVTGFLVRSIASKWVKGSVLAVDAGSHLASIQSILEKDFPLVANAHNGGDAANQQPQRPPTSAVTPQKEVNSLPERPSQEIRSSPCSSDTGSRSSSPEITYTTLDHGPFAGLAFPCASARANAVHVVREHVSTYLITHPHLDHLAAFAINTAAFHNTSRPKRLAALPFAVNAIKTHIFNDVIWPNLTDEDNGVGFVTFQRLTEGGNAALGDGYSRGFIEVCDGLAVKGFKVSHGRCAGTPRMEFMRRNSLANIVADTHVGTPYGGQHSHSHAAPNGGVGNRTPAPPPPIATEGRRASIFSQSSQPGTPSFYGTGGNGTNSTNPDQCVVDSSAFFIRADDTGREILMFGDVEPDSISIAPRNHIIWAEAAPKIAQGILSGIFIECSYSDAQPDSMLFGHLTPRHLIKELEVLAEMVAERRKEIHDKVGRKRKRHSSSTHLHHASSPDAHRSSRSRSAAHTHRTIGRAETMLEESEQDNNDVSMQDQRDISPHTTRRSHSHSHSHSHTRHSTFVSMGDPTLKGVKVVIMHVKDTMTDGPLMGDIILRELKAHEARLAAAKRELGCVFEVSVAGASYFF